MAHWDAERRLILDRIAPDTLGQDDLAHADRVLLACQQGIDAGDDIERNAASALLLALPDNASEWLDHLDAALQAAPLADPLRHAALRGAFKIARLVGVGYDTTLGD